MAIEESHRRKAIIALSILAVLSQLTVMPAFCRIDISFKRLGHFTSTFDGYVTDIEGPFFRAPNLVQFHIITEGIVIKGDFYGSSVIIDERILLHLDSGSGLSKGSFTVSDSNGKIFVTFTAKVKDYAKFEGKFEIEGGTDSYKGVRGHGILYGSASGEYDIDTEVVGVVEGYIWYMER
jgi:hypothetical protein